MGRVRLRYGHGIPVLPGVSRRRGNEETQTLVLAGEDDSGAYTVNDGTLTPEALNHMFDSFTFECGPRVVYCPGCAGYGQIPLNAPDDSHWKGCRFIALKRELEKKSAV